MSVSFGKRMRRKAGAVLVDRFFSSLPRVGRLHPKVRYPERYGMRVDKDVPYRDTGLVEHTLDVYRPVDASGPLPVMVYVHGGGFRTLSKDTHFLMGMRHARRGYVVFVVSYRLAPRHRYPAAVEDVADALAWIAENAGRYGGDIDRLVLAGESAGANLATVAAICMSWPRPEPAARRIWDLGLRPMAVTPMYGVYQVSDPGRFSRRKPGMSKFLQDRIDDVSESYLPTDGSDAALADPLVILETAGPPERPLPPFFTAVGTRDPILDDTRRLSAALERLGVRCDTRYYVGEVHAFNVFVWRPAAQDCWTRHLQFLAEIVGA